LAGQISGTITRIANHQRYQIHVVIYVSICPSSTESVAILMFLVFILHLILIMSVLEFMMRMAKFENETRRLKIACFHKMLQTINTGFFFSCRISESTLCFRLRWMKFLFSVINSEKAMASFYHSIPFLLLSYSSSFEVPSLTDVLKLLCC